jgi:antitoxin (DNA-binding transcriptional repressor) of toxin-antitoxin stability system
MSISASDVMPFTQACANLSELADQVNAGAEEIITKNCESYVALIDADRLDPTTFWSLSAFTCCCLKMSSEAWKTSPLAARKTATKRLPKGAVGGSITSA